MRLVAAIALAAPLFGQETLFGTAADIESGTRWYRANCAVCHGLDARGGRGPDLTTGTFRHGGRDQDLFQSINEGIKGTEMPPIRLEGRQTWQIIAFLRSLARRPKAVKGTGDPAAGRAVFEGKGGCTACHRVGDRGSRTGPDLSDAGLRLSREEIREALLRPDARVTPRNWYARAEYPGGRVVYGRRLNEDTHSAQLIDNDERLVSVLKSELKSFRVVKESPMPPVEGRLTTAEIDGLVEYLAGLR
ncbi:MAG: c-type cytochrome [Acidobacteria bacterium]|nr:c-type cytochrome [Acidobacteriota bacterium]